MPDVTGIGAATYADRRERLAVELAQSTLPAQAYLVSDPANVDYLCGLRSSNAAALLRPAAPTLLATDERYLQAAHDRATEAPTPSGPGSIEVLRTSQVLTQLADLAVADGLDAVLVDYECLTLAEAGRVRNRGDGTAVELHPIGDLVSRMRMVKDDGELRLIQAACEIAVSAWETMLTGPHAYGLRGHTEREIATELEIRMLRLGAQAPAFATIVAAGPNGARPHHQPTDRPVRPGELVTVDFGAMWSGYHSDCTRTVLAGGRPSTWQQEVYQAVRQAQQAGREALVADVSAAQVDAATRNPLQSLGLGAAYGHGAGHGVGLAIHEAPMLNALSEDMIRAGSVVTVEPGVYLPGLGGVRIEDTLVVGTAARVLTDLTRDLLVV